MSGFVTPTKPNLADFTTFVFNALSGAPGYSSGVLPTDSPFIGYALKVSCQIVYRRLNEVSPLLYTLAVYNLGMDTLLNFCPDQEGQTFFSTLRGPPPNGYGLYGFVAGVVTAAADVSTSDSLVTPEFMAQLTLANLQQLKTPFGRQYLSIVQSMGTLWGLS